MTLSLVPGAAGLGRRGGGRPQAASVGRGGATRLDASFDDARRAAVGRIGCVLRPDFEDEPGERTGRRFASRVEISLDNPLAEPGAVARGVGAVDAGGRPNVAAALPSPLGAGAHPARPWVGAAAR